jgi:hypothetical protein
MLHDRVNDQLVGMVTRHGSEHVTEVEPGVISFDGRLFDWWQPS